MWDLVKSIFGRWLNPINMYYMLQLFEYWVAHKNAPPPIPVVMALELKHAFWPKLVILLWYVYVYWPHT